MMTADMNECLIQDGVLSALAIVEKHTFSLLLETFLFALYIVLVVYLIVCSCATREAKSQPTFVLLYTLSMFGLFSAYWVLDVYFLRAEYRSLLTHCSTTFGGPKAKYVYWKGASWINKDGLLSQYFAPVYVQYIVELILVVLGDFVSLWRAYVIFGRSRWLYILFVFVAAVEGVAYVLICLSASMQYSYSGSVSSGVKALAEARTPLTFLGYAITGLAQLASTTLIAYKAWLHWKEVRMFMHRSTTRRGLTALAIVIESGVVYLVLLTWYGAITYFGGSSSLLAYTCRFYCAPLIAMYPTLVVVLVASRHSVLERSSIGSGMLSDAISPHLRSSLTVLGTTTTDDLGGGAMKLTSIVSLESRSEYDAYSVAAPRPA